MDIIMKSAIRSILPALLFSSSAFAIPVNINTDKADYITTGLSGVSATTAQAIVSYRESNGPFKSVYNLILVKGISAEMIGKNLTNIQLIDKVE